MSSPAAPKNAVPPAPEYDVVAGVLSYFVPGLGQVVQGRVGKGLLFLVCIYVLFFYGTYLGTASVVVDGREYRVGGNVYLPDNADRVNPFGLPRLLANLYNRPQFLGQFWVGIAAWPAIWQYWHYDDHADDVNGRAERGDSIFGQYQRTPSEEANNAVQNAGDKLFELSWVYTVIAGVLNVMVIYDALAGPAFPAQRDEPSTRTAT
jgi:hypothetical protein